MEGHSAGHRIISPCYTCAAADAEATNRVGRQISIAPARNSKAAIII